VGLIPKNELTGEGVGSCPLCSGSEYVVDWKYQDKSYVHCKKCGLAFVTPFAGDDAAFGANGNSSETKQSYSRMMRNRAEGRGKYAVEMGKRRVEQYSRLLGRTPRTILEIGAGDGAFSFAYDTLGIEYLGVDVDPNIVEVAQALGRKVELGGIERAKEAGKRYDVIFSSQALEHVLRPVPLLMSAGDLLKSDGILHLDVPNHAGLASMVRRVHP
jgi:2-polyprenyl-3-methyl-5-hydroxy-6-metoxy-1,4-benzoquinol methylase